MSTIYTGRMRDLGEVVYNIRAYGAVGDWNGTTGTSIKSAVEDTIAQIEADIASGDVTKARVLFPPAPGWACAGALVIPAGIDVDMRAPLYYTGGIDEVALTIGDASVNNHDAYLRLAVIRATQSDWTSDSCVGIRIVNSMTSTIHVLNAEKFTIGAQFYAAGGRGFAYNEITLGRVISNRIAVDLANVEIGYVNENTFRGGRFAVTSGVNRSTSRYGIRVVSLDATYLNNNNNRFHSPSFELNENNLLAGEAVPVLIEHGLYNYVHNARDENNSSTVLRTLNGSAYNEVELGYSGPTAAVDDQSTSPTNRLVIRRDVGRDGTRAEVFDSGPVHKRACLYNGSTTYHVPRLFAQQASSGTPTKAVSNIVINSDYLELTARGLGIYVNTRTAKRFTVKVDAEPNFGGRLYVRCYDASGSLLTNAGTGHPYVRGRTDKNLSWSTNYGGSYGTGADSNSPTYFAVGEDVAYVAVIVSSGSAALYLRSFVIESTTAVHVATWPGYEEIVPGAHLGTSAPTTGTWERGMFIYNDTPSIQGEAGSRFVVQGWRKVTALGSSNVAGTDWVAVRTLTGT